MSESKRRWALVAGAAVFLAAAATPKRRRLASASVRRSQFTSALPEPAPSTSPLQVRSWLRLLLAILALVVLVVVSVQLYCDFMQISDFPAQPPEAGEVRLYFDKPGVPALLEGRVYERNGQIDVSVSVDKSYEQREAGFLLVFSGPISRPPEVPVDREQDEHGCWRTIYVIPENPSVACSTRRASTNGLQVNPKDTDQLVISGRLDLRAEGAKFVQITIYPGHSYATSAGKRTYFKLPQFGVSIPSSFRSAPLDFATGSFVFAPSKLDVIVDYRDLKPHEKVEAVAPAPFEPGKLSWVEVDASMVRPWGALVDMEVEDSAQRKLFVIGVAVGLLGGIGTSLVASLWTRIIEMRAAKRSDRHRRSSQLDQGHRQS